MVSDRQEENIYLLNDIIFDCEISIAEKNVKINGLGHDIKYANEYNNSLFKVGQTGSLSLNNVTIDGENLWNYNTSELEYAIQKSKERVPVYAKRHDMIVRNENEKVLLNPVIYSNGNVELNNTIIKNCYFEEDANRNVIFSAGEPEKFSEVTLNNSTITHCIGSVGTAVLGTNSLIKIKGNSKISDIFSVGKYGGAIEVKVAGEILIEGGKIKNNISLVRESLIYASGEAKIVINGGSIEDNKALCYSDACLGSIIGIRDSCSIEMNNGVIQNNTGLLVGAMSSRWIAKSGYISTKLNGGTIKDNNTYVTNTFNNSSILSRGEVLITNNMVVNGNITVSNDGDSDGIITNEGVINGNIYLNGKGSNTGTINGNVSKGDSEFTNS